MTTQANKIEVTVFGHTIALASDESKEHIIQSAERVDSMMKAIAEKSRIHDAKSIALLAAIQISHQLNTVERLIEHNKQTHKKLIDHISDELSESLCL